VTGSCYLRYSSLALSCHVVHRVLHSFPTRRSSDLYLRRTSTQSPELTSARLSREHWPPDLVGAASELLDCSHPVACNDRCPGRRSEVHTSELQSRENLVCRLLLEKKKYTQKCSAQR